MSDYYTGLITDCSGLKTYKLDSPAYFAVGVPPTGVPAGGASTITVVKNAAGLLDSPSQTGLLLMYRDAKSKQEADLITVTP